jgi:hypothetical protein
MKTTDSKDILTLSEVAEVLQLYPLLPVYGNGKITTGFKIGRAWRLRRNDVMAATTVREFFCCERRRNPNERM